ncbi:MAG: hypothetical protein GTO63_15695 [Anaerolineae bacterium]|nr:hypothetical protein [Anaerolineae bacterium]NIN96272.1 hypothetical protein [Anaerolineae bacterium]NIQ79292.1 hypothetical protein [Anaerolineae bacterium]
MPYEPPDPPNPSAPEQPEAKTAAQKAGYWGETKESGSDPTRGEKHWDPQWEKRARKILGSDTVGSLGDLYDPQHRRWLNKQLRKAKGKGKEAAAAAAPVEEVADTGVEESDGGLKPTAQGGRKQWEDISAGEQLGSLFPERRVPGEEPGDEAMPGGNMADESRVDPDAPGTAGDQYQTGLWSEEDQSRVQDAQRGTAGGTDTGEQLQTGLWGPEDQARAGETGDVTAEDQRSSLADTGLWTGPEAGGDGVRLPTEDWPPRRLPVTFYTGGM